MRSIVFLVLIFISFTSFSQKKKKNPYEDYWKQQEITEQFEAKSTQAHTYFKENQLHKALAAYKEALKLRPDDQKTIAKIRDIEILIQKREAARVEEKAEAAEPQKQIEEKEELTEAPVAEPEPVVVERQQAPATVDKQLSAETPKPQNSAVQPTTAVSEPTEAQPASKPYKNSENYRKYLAVVYKQGWTEESLEEKGKKIYKRIYVSGDSGDEYSRVTHHYGAVYYFKNGASISYGTWVAETKGFKP